MKRSALFCISSLGLGHAARSAPVVRSYLDTHEVHVLTHAGALAFLRAEFADAGVTFHDFQDYPPLERGRGSWKFYAYLVADSLGTVAVIQREHAFIRRLAREIRPEFIYSDGRYGAHLPGIPSVILSHQISFVMPPGFGLFQRLADFFNRQTFAKFDAVLVPDYEDPARSLSGALSHHHMLRRLKHEFVGILTLSPRQPETVRDIDFLFAISGYLPEHRPAFIAGLLEVAKRLPGRKVFVLGDPTYTGPTSVEEHDIEIHPSVSGALRRDLFNRAKAIISRAGYTTIMDLVELETPGYLVPTPGQTEQEYLARFLGDQGYFMTCAPDRLDFPGLEEIGRKTRPFPAGWKTEESVRRVRAFIAELVRTRN